jgi:N-acetylmuramic acid 6-phosphate (MurNAc-6-P) etherase
MRTEQAHANTGSKELIVAAVMDLAFVVAALLSVGSAPAKHATFSIEAARPRAAEVVSISANSTPPLKETADTLDLQLD